jgi:WD40 repeat protein
MICAGMDLKIYDAQTGASLLNIRPSNDQYRYTVSDDGAYTVFCNENSGSIFLWDTWEGEQITSLKMSSEPACSWLDFSADSQYLASSLGAVWQIPDGELLMEIPLRGTSQVPAMDFSPNNELLLIYPQIYDLETGERLLQVSFIGGYNKAAWFLPDGITLVSRTDNTIQFWQVRE